MSEGAFPAPTDGRGEVEERLAFLECVARTKRLVTRDHTYLSAKHTIARTSVYPYTCMRWCRGVPAPYRFVAEVKESGRLLHGVLPPRTVAPRSLRDPWVPKEVYIEKTGDELIVTHSLEVNCDCPDSAHPRLQPGSCSHLRGSARGKGCFAI